jgi:hypothetical protein
MNNKQLQPVSYEQAVALNELGFDYLCYTHYMVTVVGGEQVLVTSYDPSVVWRVEQPSAPTVAHALMWMRQEKGIKYSLMGWPQADGKITYSALLIGRYYSPEEQNIQFTKSWEEAESELLDKCIEVLKKKGGEK